MKKYFPRAGGNSFDLPIDQVANRLDDPGVLCSKTRLRASCAGIENADRLARQGGKHHRLPHQGSAAGI
jgi:hypothetical protein